MEDKDIQKQTDYEPTPAESRLLEVLLNPDHRFKSVVEKCQLADIARQTYYDAFKKPEFLALQKSMAAQIASQHVLPTMHAYAKEAVRGSVSHGSVILDMAGIYSPKQRVEHSGKVEGFSLSSPEEIRAQLESIVGERNDQD